MMALADQPRTKLRTFGGLESIQHCRGSRGRPSNIGLSLRDPHDNHLLSAHDLIAGAEVKTVAQFALAPSIDHKNWDWGRFDKIGHCFCSPVKLAPELAQGCHNSTARNLCNLNLSQTACSRACDPVWHSPHGTVCTSRSNPRTSPLRTFRLPRSYSASAAVPCRREARAVGRPAPLSQRRPASFHFANVSALRLSSFYVVPTGRDVPEQANVAFFSIRRRIRSRRITSTPHNKNAAPPISNIVSSVSMSGTMLRLPITVIPYPKRNYAETGATC